MCVVTLKMDKPCLAILLIHVAFFGMSSGLECLSCTGVRHMLDCKQLQRCGPHEDCYASRNVDVNGVLLWDLGCKDRLRCTQPQAIGKRASGDTLICDQCCNSTLCQETLCGNKKPTRLGPICYSCSAYDNANDCYTLTSCDLNENCYVSRSHYQPTDQDIFQSGCITQHQCASLQRFAMFGGNLGSCPMCCDSDLCNKKCTSSV